MSLPASGPLSISQIAAEFGVALPCVFPDAFYGKPGVPGSGALTMSSFHGMSNVTFSPDGGYLFNSGSTYASVVISCNVAAVWTYSGTGTFGASVSIASGGSALYIVFSIETTKVPKSTHWSVSATAAGVTRTYEIDLSVDGTL